MDENRKDKTNSIVEEGTLRKMIRKILYNENFVDIEENIDFIFDHLKQTNRLAQGFITKGKSQTKILKVAPIGQTLNSDEIQQDEKAPFQIKEMIEILESDILVRSQRVVEMNKQIKQYGLNNEKSIALRLLRTRKGVEKFINGQNDRKCTLELALQNIEQGMQDLGVFEALRAGKEAGEQINKGKVVG